MHTATDVQSTSTTTPTNTRNEDKLDAKPAAGTPPKRGKSVWSHTRPLAHSARTFYTCNQEMGITVSHCPQDAPAIQYTIEAKSAGPTMYGSCRKE